MIVQTTTKYRPVVKLLTNGISSVFIKILDILRGVNGYHWASYNQKHMRFKGFSTSNPPTYSETFANIVIQNMKELLLWFNIDMGIRKQWGWNLVYNYNQHNITIVWIKLALFLAPLPFSWNLILWVSISMGLPWSQGSKHSWILPMQTRSLILFFDYGFS